MVGAVRGDPAARTQGQKWSSSSGSGADVADLFRPALVQSGDRACEEALYDRANLRRFVGIDLNLQPLPDETTLLHFRRLLESKKLGEALLARVN